MEFLGKSTFVPGLWVSSLLFFLTNAWLLGIVVSDVGEEPRRAGTVSSVKPTKKKQASR